MKKYFSLLIIAASLSMFVACGGGGKQTAADKEFGKLEVEIPKELEDNEEVVQFIEGMAEVTDEYALLLDETLEKTKKYHGKKNEELSMMEQVKLMAITGDVAVKSVAVMEKWGKYVDQRTNLEEQLSEDEMKALEVVYARFEERIEQIQEKHGEVLNEETEYPPQM